MSVRDFINRKFTLATFVTALALFILSMAGNNSVNDTDKVAAKLGRRIDKRVELLDRYIGEALATPPDQLMEIRNLPEDMVIYRYVNDSLQSWCNQFSVLNDDISSRLVFQRLTNLRSRIVSPLSEVTEELSFMNFGPKWYIVKMSVGDWNEKVIAGIEIKNRLVDDVRKSDNGVNPKLRLDGRYSVMPVNYSGGSAVEIGGKPLFKIFIETSGQPAPFFDNSILRWIALALFTLASLLFLAMHRTLKVYFTVLATQLVLFLMAFTWGLQMVGKSEMFSPTIYADGPLMFSLGALLLINTAITTFNFSTFLIRGRLNSMIMRSGKARRRYLALYGLLTILAAIVTFAYTHLSLRSLVNNSNVTLELYRWNTNISYTILIYLSYTGLLVCILLQIQTLRPFMREFFKLRYNIFDTRSLVACAFLFALYFTVTSSVLGFAKEQDRVHLWANRLAVDRDLGVEIQLRSVEDEIAGDQVVRMLASLDNTSGLIQNRLSESYFQRIRQMYDLKITLIRDKDKNGIIHFNNILRTGSPIADGSRFLFISKENGTNCYVGAFLFWVEDVGLTRMLVTLDSIANREDRGYDSILGKFSYPGEIQIPYYYSYAKYIGSRLVSYKGNYPYPTVFHSDDLLRPNKIYTNRDKGFVHFTTAVADDELITISRPTRSEMTYFTAFSYLFLALLGFLMLFSRANRKPNAFKSNYFRRRINSILFGSSCLILVSMMSISVIFVYKRNESNMQNLMSTKISTVQALVNVRTRNMQDWQDMQTPEFAGALENISNTTKSDITFYTPSGLVFRSTTPEVFEKMILGCRIDQDAFYNIRYLNQRFYIHNEKIDDMAYWSLYAPVFNDKGQTLAIMSIPYTEKSYDFRRETFFHAAMILCIFLLLLIGSLLFSTKEVNSLFAPLIEMGRKMSSADIHNLEYIVYKREDELTSLVDAYNRMVHDLSDSTRQLAQAERDKAWSQMARQVAHEIKNPLTPIKLEIQRLIRLKQKNNPAWEEKFDKVAGVILEHIDILTDTANEFSTFAKLYSEDPVLMDIDKALKDQLLIFDNKENIRIQYIGMENACVMAPKPQLIRVFVNLITNALQAVEIQQKEAIDKGLEPKQGRVVICLRNSTKDGCYDIVFDDNGPGVSEENLGKLFTPNFTTKSGGTGLGLAICRNIIEKCDGEIRYSRSFALGGACFTVTLPKNTGGQRA
ncbi:MAG: sensor histidine kinase [Candidatus Cryptobacteroides sp.]